MYCILYIYSYAKLQEIQYIVLQFYTECHVCYGFPLPKPTTHAYGFFSDKDLVYFLTRVFCFTAVNVLPLVLFNYINPSCVFVQCKVL